MTSGARPPANKGLLLDTPTLLWFDTDPERLPQTVAQLLRQKGRRVYVSSLTIWELTIKNRLGKLPEAKPLLDALFETLFVYGFLELTFTTPHALKNREFAPEHKDPFDRALVAQAMCEDLALVSMDPQMNAFRGVTVVWG